MLYIMDGYSTISHSFPKEKQSKIEATSAMSIKDWEQWEPKAENLQVFFHIFSEIWSSIHSFIFSFNPKKQVMIILFLQIKISNIWQNSL